MPLNDPYEGSRVRHPRLRFLAAGHQVDVALSARVTQTNAFHAARFSVTFAPPIYNNQPVSGAGSFTWWSQQKDLLGKVQLGLVPDDGTENDVVWTTMLTGEVDTITAHPTNWLVHIEGRDLTRRFIDNKTEEAYVNQTSSQIVSLLAAKEGLSVQATPTTTPVGRYYQIDHDRISLDQFHRSLTEWDLITMLARYEGFDAYVDGTTLYFQKATPPSADPWVARWQIDENGIQSSNLLDLQMERALTIAKGIQVVVKSWHGKRARAFVRGAPASTEIRSPSQSNTQQYIIVRPNLTEDQAQQLANQVYSDLSRHEKVITGQACGDMLLTPRVVIRLTGTGTDWDQVYYPVEITRHIDDHGFLMDFRAHILPPAAESVL